MKRKPEIMEQLDPTPPATTHDYLTYIQAARGYAEGITQRLNEVERLTPSWPEYMYEQVSDFEIPPPDPLAQAAVNLGTYLGNINLRLDALLNRLNTPSS